MINNSQTIDKALVVGGGIGGLCATLALLSLGIEVKIYEKATELRAIGAGMSLDPNGSNALGILGLRTEIQELVGPAVDGIGLRDWRDGSWLSYLPVSALENKFGMAPIGVYRPALQQILLQAVKEDGGQIECGAGLVNFEQDSQRVTAYFANGQSDSAAILIGADGIHSKVREQLWGQQAKVRPAHQIYWRSAIEFDHRRLKAAGELWGPGNGLVFGAMPLRNGMVHWYAVHNSKFEQDFLAKADPEEIKLWLLQQFSGSWISSCRELIESTPATSIVRTEIADLKPLTKWSAGRVTLLGDAAHAMNPALGQGASQAAEDAVVLATVLKQFGQVELALQHYEQTRIPRTTKLIKQARAISNIMQVNNLLLARTRNALFKTFFSGDKNSLRQLQWLYDYKFS